MNTLTKLAMGLMGQLRPAPPVGDSAPAKALPPARHRGGTRLVDALRRRQSQRAFSPKPLTAQQLADVLWAATGINRPELGGRTAPSAMNAQEVLVYAALAEGLYVYDPAAHQLRLAAATDVRRVSGYQDFVDTAPLDLIYVADHDRMTLVPPARRQGYAFAAAGAMAQNVYLTCASLGLSTVIRGWFDGDALTRAMALGPDHEVLLAQTVGRPGAAAATASSAP
ncbi:SagB/ThcOx family dehydrogenase [Ideonella sp. A 288]|uniref:SagB/ThcOx family dehydrogenase n=1 Tax=Ideonella sp. A 288 TaxID=1962181 RepID=UPI000B4A6C80|nr:SagB/ThcOx family dehydrogenase [Ideonella sp. A 288]